jgi:hypothetical protein
MAISLRKEKSKVKLLKDFALYCLIAIFCMAGASACGGSQAAPEGSGSLQDQAPTVVQALPPYRVPATVSYGQPLVEKMLVPAQQVNGVITPAHYQEVIIQQGAYTVTSQCDFPPAGTGAKTSAYTLGSDNPGLPSQQKQFHKPSGATLEVMPRISVNFKDSTTLEKALQDISWATGFRAYTGPGVNKSQRVSFKAEQMPLHQVVDRLIRPLNYRATINKDRSSIYIYVPS